MTRPLGLRSSRRSGHRRRYLPAVVAAVLPLSGAAVLLGASAASASVPGPVTYSSTAAPIAATVPAGVCSISFTAIGGQGGGSQGGLGGEVTATVAVTPSEAYSVSVGAAGGPGVSAHGGIGGVSGGAASGGAGGVGGGGNLGGGGGGATTVSIGGAAQPVLVAAGGGGTGTGYPGTNAVASNAGGGAGAIGQNGTSAHISSVGGRGGTATTAGPGGSGGADAGLPGVNSVGGAGVSEQGAGGGGGGGALAGGGGGDDYAFSAGGGGGGANLAPTGSSFDGTATATGNGSVTATFTACPPASAPTGVRAIGGSGSATLSWTAPTGSASPVTGYDIYEGSSPGAEGATPINAAPVTGTTYTVTGLKPGTTYYFTVEAINAGGNSVSSPEFSAATTPAAACSPVVVSTVELRHGSYQATNCGNVYNHRLPFRGSPVASGATLNGSVVAMALDSGHNGYFVVTAAGNVFNEHAVFRGSPHASGVELASPVTGIRVRKGGYTLTTADGVTYRYGR